MNLSSRIISYIICIHHHICLFVHNTISLLSLCKLIWRRWTYKMLVIYILSSVWVRLSIFSQSSITQYVGLCVFRLPISLVMIEIIYMYIYIYIHTVLLSSSNQKFELLPIVYGYVIKQWYALSVFLYSYGSLFSKFTESGNVRWKSL